MPLRWFADKIIDACEDERRGERQGIIFDMDISNLTVLFVTHSLTDWAKEEWVEFLRVRCKKLIFIDHPFSYSFSYYSKDIRSSITIFKNGQKVAKRYCRFPRNFNDIFFYIKDCFLNVFWTLSIGKIDLCICLNPLNAFSLLGFRKIGLIKKLIYYVIDYIPNRFPSKAMNSFYHFIDKRCCYDVDYIWSLSPRMKEGRREKGIDIEKCAPSVIVPMGADLSRIEILPIEKIDRHTIVYMGALLEKQGIQLVLRVIPEIVKEVPDLKFVIIGKGAYEPQIRNLIKELGVENYIELKGYIKDHTEVEKILCRCAIGLATYTIDDNSFTYYTDPGKIKTYLGCGLPVVVTKFPLIAYEAEKNKAGFAIDYDNESLKKALLKLLIDDKLYAEMRRNALIMSKKYNWFDICKNALEDCGYTISR